MCIGVPLQVLAVDGLAARCCDAGGAERLIDLAVIGAGAVRPGQWLLTFLGRADRVIGAGEAAQIIDAHAAVAAVMAGAPVPEGAFADLERPPALPPHLAAARAAGRTLA